MAEMAAMEARLTSGFMLWGGLAGVGVLLATVAGSILLECLAYDSILIRSSTSSWKKRPSCPHAPGTWRSATGLIFGLAKLADYRDTDTGRHLERRSPPIANCSRTNSSGFCATRSTRPGLEPPQACQLDARHRQGRHPRTRSLSFKPGPLTPDEPPAHGAAPAHRRLRHALRRQLRHAAWGTTTCSTWAFRSPSPHHERFDGQGVSMQASVPSKHPALGPHRRPGGHVRRTDQRTRLQKSHELVLSRPPRSSARTAARTSTPPSSTPMFGWSRSSTARATRCCPPPWKSRCLWSLPSGPSGPRPSPSSSTASIGDARLAPQVPRWADPAPGRRRRLGGPGRVGAYLGGTPIPRPWTLTPAAPQVELVVTGVGKSNAAAPSPHLLDTRRHGRRAERGRGRDLRKTRGEDRRPRQHLRTCGRGCADSGPRFIDLRRTRVSANGLGDAVSNRSKAAEKPQANSPMPSALSPPFPHTQQRTDISRPHSRAARTGRESPNPWKVRPSPTPPPTASTCPSAGASGNQQYHR